ncbi:MAG: hypothetical protein IH995_00450 [Proteobacteria bacterium]|nr:hypothetical protein [Pseudomonadota bacterium]
MYGKMRTFLLVLMIAALGNFIPANASAQEKISFTEKVAKLQALRAEQDAMGKKWLENKEKLDGLGSQYEALDAQMAEGLGRLGKLRGEAETVMREYERKIPEFDRKQARLDAKVEEQNRDVEAHNARCDRTFDVETEAAALAACDASYARGTAADQKLTQEINTFEREAQALEDKTNRAVEAHDKLLEELQQKEVQQQELVRQGTALEASSAEILEAGLRLDALIKELEGSTCQPGEFRTAEAFEECMRTIFDGGDGTKPPLEKWTPVDMSPTGEKETSPYDLDPNVVKPDWGEEEDDEG